MGQACTSFITRHAATSTCLQRPGQGCIGKHACAYLQLVVHMSDASGCVASTFQEMLEAETAKPGLGGQARGLPDRLRNWSGRMGGSLTAMVDNLTKGACSLRIVVP